MSNYVMVGMKENNCVEKRQNTNKQDSESVSSGEKKKKTGKGEMNNNVQRME